MADRPAGSGKGEKKPGAWAQIFASRRMAITAALGFASGLPILFTGQVLNLWLTDADIDIKTIALFLWVGFPYTIKFLWAPLLDRYAPPLGRRRGWILISQIGLVGIVVAMGSADPASSIWTVAVLTFILATLGATQDVAIDAWRADILTPDERAAGSAVYVFGYRVALLVIGTGGLIMADFVGYRALFLGTAALLALCMVATVLAEEPTQSAARPHNLVEAVVLPFTRFFKKLGWGALVALAFAAFYKFGDQMVDGLIGTFWRRELELTKTQIGTITKFSGTIGVVLGGLLAGILTPRLGTKRALILFGILQAFDELPLPGARSARQGVRNDRAPGGRLDLRRLRGRHDGHGGVHGGLHRHVRQGGQRDAVRAAHQPVGRGQACVRSRRRRDHRRVQLGGVLHRDRSDGHPGPHPGLVPAARPLAAAPQAG